MKKSIAATLRFASPPCVKSVRLKACWCIVMVCSAGCTTTHVQWDAVQMREHVVDYYNDEIMDNLVRAVNGQPFVHVDVAGLQALAGSKLAGTVNGGQTETHTTGTSPATSVAGVVGTLSRAVMRPFTFSVNPERTDTLTITSTPVIGSIPPPRPGECKQPNIYDLYLQFLNLKSAPKETETFPDLSGKAKADFSYLRVSGDCESVQKVCTLKERLSPPRYVPGTLKSLGDCVYYVPIAYQKAYLELFRALLIAQRPKSMPPSGPVQAVSVE